jgi:3-deoxy-7-phosphoheptulonate synthase
MQVAVDACRAAAVTTVGNPDTHVILRGGRSGPNYQAEYVSKALDLISEAGLPGRVMVDASHGNSGKDHRRQVVVADAIANQLTAGERGLAGVMLESFLVEGRQEPGDRAHLVYGRSVVHVRRLRSCTPRLGRAVHSAICRQSPRPKAGRSGFAR